MAIVAVLALVLGARAASAWGPEGHQTVAGVAAAGLTSQALEQVRLLLNAAPGKEELRMRQVSTWGDDVRGWHKNWVEFRKSHPGALLTDAGVDVPADLESDSTERELARTFIEALAAQQAGAKPVEKALDRQSNRHYTNLPLGTASYEDATIGTGPDDCVQGIWRCVKVLKGTPAAHEVMNKQQALRFLIHYVGDLHQPLHAGVGYWMVDAQSDTTRLCTPEEAREGVNDLGGNSIPLNDEMGHAIPGPHGKMNFHAYWDGTMVSESRKATGTGAQFRQHLIDLVRMTNPAPAWRLPSQPSILAQAKLWSAESAGIAKDAYAALRSGGIKLEGAVGREHLTGAAVLPASYASDFRPQTNQRLARGGLRLAQVLNAIWH